MAATDPIRDIELLIRSRYSIIVLDTPEVDRAETLLTYLADRMRLPLFLWTATKGLRRYDNEAPIYGTGSLPQALAHIENSRFFSAVYAFEDMGPLLEDPMTAARVRDASARFKERTGAMVFIGPGLSLPEVLKPLSAAVSLPAPDIQEYRNLLHRIIRDITAKRPVSIELGPEEINRLLNNLRGLTLLEAEKILTRAIIEDGRLNAEDIRQVIEAKKAIVEREGLLEYYPVEERMEDIADLAGLKDWLRKRQGFLTDPQKASRFGLSFPKGVLLLGVQGCGKSLCAKAVAMEWGLPLLKLDPSSLYNKYIGESEKNFKRAMQTAEKMAPVVLWIDEIEKAFASSGSAEDGGVSQRILGTFLSWLQDRKGDVFVVATANDIARLPPEFIRKGRFDEIFFVDLPNREAREAIFRIHLKKRGQSPAKHDIGKLVEAADGFSGSEIEQAILSGLYTAFSAGKELSTGTLLDEVSRTRPLSQTMAEKIDDLRRWAVERTVSAQ